MGVAAVANELGPNRVEHSRQACRLRAPVRAADLRSTARPRTRCALCTEARCCRRRSCLRRRREPGGETRESRAPCSGRALRGTRTGHHPASRHRVVPRPERGVNPNRPGEPTEAARPRPAWRTRGPRAIQSAPYRKSRKTRLADIIERFLDGTGGRWDWDDFTSLSITDPELDAIRVRCGQLYDEPTYAGRYCGPEGMVEIRRIIEKLRSPS